MKGMLRVSMLVCMVFCLSACLTSCATVQLPENATQQQKEEAKKSDCAAAKALADESDRELARLKSSGNLDQDAISYWTWSGIGARAALTGVCAGYLLPPQPVP